MKYFVIVVLLLSTCSISLAGGGSPRFTFTISVENISKTHGNTFDSIILVSHFFDHNTGTISPENFWQMGDNDSLLITNPTDLNLSYIDNSLITGRIYSFEIFFSSRNSDVVCKWINSGGFTIYQIPSKIDKTLIDTLNGSISISLNNFVFSNLSPNHYHFKYPPDYTTITYHWYCDDKEVDSLLNKTIIYPLTPGNYYCKAIGGNGNVVGVSDTITTDENFHDPFSNKCVDNFLKSKSKCDCMNLRDYYGKKLDKSLHLFPNPFAQELKMNFEVCRETTFFVKIMDVQGNTIYTSSSILTAGIYQSLPVDISFLKDGMYLFQIGFDDYYATKKIIKSSF